MPRRDKLCDLADLADRCEREEPGFFSDLDWCIHRAAGRSRLSYFVGQSDYTTNLQAAASLFPDWVEWQLTNLYGVARAAAPLNHNTMICDGTHKGGLLPMAVCAAALRCLAALDQMGA